MQNLIAYSICGEYISSAIQAGGLPIVSANGKDLGPNLIRVGFVEVTGALQKGDVAIIQAIDGHPYGHACMYDGKTWYSDFKQNSMYPGPGYRKVKPSYKIYRHL